MWAALCGLLVTAISWAAAQFPPKEVRFEWVWMIFLAPHFPGAFVVALISVFTLPGGVHAMDQLAWLIPGVNFVIYLALFYAVGELWRKYISSRRGM